MVGLIIRTASESETWDASVHTRASRQYSYFNKSGSPAINGSDLREKAKSDTSPGKRITTLDGNDVTGDLYKIVLHRPMGSLREMTWNATGIK
jgi:hypothetical protein